MSTPFRTATITTGRTHAHTAEAICAVLDNPDTRPTDDEHVFFDLDGTGYGIKASRTTKSMIALFPAATSSYADGTTDLRLLCDMNAPVGVSYHLWNGTPSTEGADLARRGTRLAVMRAHRARLNHLEVLARAQAREAVRANA